jgi:hypothetical protein
VRLSRSFFMRDFLYSEIASIHGIPNVPDDPDLAIEVGRQLCEELLEPLNATFGRLAVRSAFRSEAVNDYGNRHKLGCASNEKNYARHIWDRVGADGGKGAMACIVVPWFSDRYTAGADWRSLAYWIHDHLDYSELEFFPRLCAFNIGWHETPAKLVTSSIEPRGTLLRGLRSSSGKQALYGDFPPLKR